jgi:hypothetical protein
MIPTLSNVAIASPVATPVSVKADILSTKTLQGIGGAAMMASPLGPSLISCSEVPSSTMVNSGLFLGMKKEMPVRASSLSLMVVSSLGNSNVTSSLACWT